MALLVQYPKLDGFYSKVAEAMESEKKTPYELDLEVRDREPSITPKVGDWVKIKSKEWYEKWKNSKGNVYSLGSCSFLDEMVPYCGYIYKIEKVDKTYFHLEGVHFGWTLKMFEKVYPQEEYSIYKSSLGDMVMKKGKDSTDMDTTRNDDEPLSRSSVVGSCITAPTITGIGDSTMLHQNITLNDYPPFRIQTSAPVSVTFPYYHSSDKKEESQEPNLKTIKSIHFLKLEKL